MALFQALQPAFEDHFLGRLFFVRNSIELIHSFCYTFNRLDRTTPRIEVNCVITQEDFAMPYLDAALAFALTMLAVSTLVTQIVRLGQYFAGLRVRVMNEMLADYFKAELKPVIEREMNRLKNKVTDEVANEVKTKADKLGTTLPFTNDELKKLTDVSTEEIVERLKRSEMGTKLLQELGDQAKTIFDELGRRYEIVGEKFTLSFREHSRWWATGVALIVAFALNIDSLFIANTYIKNEGMRQAVVAQKDSLEKGYDTLAGKLEQEQGKTEITREEFEQAFSDAKGQLDIFTSAGFPIGQSYFPYACMRTMDSPDCQNRNNTFGIIAWILGCFLTSLLAGLGGPFWYDVVSGISRAVKSARSASTRQPAE
jgi:hypothetical protein